MLLVAMLEIRELAAFRRFEHAAAAIMARHGGAIERALLLEGAPQRELHVVRFPDAAALAAYRADPELRALGELRAAGVASTQIWAATDVMEQA